MKHLSVTTLTASTILLATIVGMPTSAQSQTVVIITGNGYAPYYPQPYPYYRPQVYAQPTFYGEPDYYPQYSYGASGYYNGYYRPGGNWGSSVFGASILPGLPLLGSLLFGR